MDKLQALMGWYSKLKLLVVRSRHPKRNPSMVDKLQRCKLKYVVEHCFEAVGLFGWDVFFLPTLLARIGV